MSETENTILVPMSVEQLPATQLGSDEQFSNSRRNLLRTGLGSEGDGRGC